MTTVCIIGNSHAASLKNAWERIKSDYENVDVVFFAARGRLLEGLRPNCGRLVPQNDRLKSYLEFTSGAAGEIDPVNYDHLLLYGLGGRAYFYDNGRYFSNAVISASFEDSVTGTLSYATLTKLRKISDKRIFIGHNPFLAASTVKDDIVDPAYLTGVEFINQNFYSRFDAELVAQPCETIVNRRYTNPKFSLGSRRLSVGSHSDGREHPQDDKAHMNDAFGHLWLKGFFERIGVERAHISPARIHGNPCSEDSHPLPKRTGAMLVRERNG